MKNGNKVLFIDDDMMFLHTQAKILMLSGFDVIKAENGDDGFDMLKVDVPDIVVCDMIMGKSSGFDFLYKFSRSEFFKKIPFLSLTGYTNETMAKRCIASGADGYLKKPVDCDVLTCAIFTLIGSYAQTRDREKRDYDLNHPR